MQDQPRKPGLLPHIVGGLGLGQPAAACLVAVFNWAGRPGGAVGDLLPAVGA
jgi:hypothetical protein